MTQVVDFIDIRISRDTAPVTRASLDVPMFLAAHTGFAERARVYTSLTAVAADFSSTSNVYQAASMFFGQEVSPPRIVIGRRQIPSVTVTPTVANTAVYSFEVQGETVTYTSDADATLAEIIDGLEASFAAAGVVGATFTDNASLTFTIAPTVAGEGFQFRTISTNLSASNALVTETLADSLAAVEQVESDFIAVTCEDHTDAGILALAAAVQGRKKVFVTSTEASAVITSSTTDIGSQLKDAGYDKTMVIYNKADEKYPECGLLGLLLPQNPGSYTAKFKSIAGATVDRLTDTQSNFAKGKNVNVYESVGGINMLSEGVMSSGAFFDEIIGALALEARLRERVFFRLANTNKIGFTRAGFTVLENDVRAVLQDFVSFGFLADAPAPSVSVPDPLDLDPNLRALRTLDAISFEARVAGAVHKVVIRGQISV